MDGAPPAGAALAALEAAAARDLAYLDYPARTWVEPRRHRSGIPVRDVVIVGAGLNGCAAGFGLLRERVANIALIDRAEPGREGPWLTYARMRRLRTAKTLVGPDLGVRSLSFPAWYEAVYGAEAWERLDKATNAEWMAYLAWFRRVAGLPIDNGVELTAVVPDDDLLVLDLVRDGEPERLATRRLVLATGALGAGGPEIPAFIADNLPRPRWAHSSEAIDFAALEGKRVAVLGAGASAFDNAAVALENGAAAVHLYARRASIEQPNVKSALEFSGFLRHFGSLDDLDRWRVMRQLARYSVPPPPSSIERCTRHDRFAVSTSCPWLSVRMASDGRNGEAIAIETPAGQHWTDFVILGTGFAVDVAARPELAGLAEQIALWRDVFTPPAGEAPAIARRLGAHPYLGPGFEYQPKPGLTAPWLGRIHDFGIGSVQSLGPVTTGLNGTKFGPTRLVQRITRSLFLEDARRHIERLERLDLAPQPADETTI
ncbi:MAG: NAD(P)/FAD-dependent oxidoreductase [Azospirillaceae bacterium]